MNDKKGILAFSLLHIIKFVLGAIITVFLLSVLWNIFGPQQETVSTQKAFDDIILKVRSLEDGQSVIAFGYVNKDAMIVSFNSDQGKAGNIVRKKECGSPLNSCICACKGDKCDSVLECKAFKRDKIEKIVMNGQNLVLEEEKGFTVKMTLKNHILTVEKVQ